MGCIILIETHIKKPVDTRIYRLFYVELVVGIEPTTCSLRMSCSAIEPHQHILFLPHGILKNKMHIAHTQGTMRIILSIAYIVYKKCFDSSSKSLNKSRKRIPKAILRTALLANKKRFVK